MANTYPSHSRLAYANRDAIQAAIDGGKLNANDIVFCKDSHQMIIVRDDLSLFEVKSKLYVFDSETEALNTLNTATDSYPGMVVSILNSKGTYSGYVVNGEKGNFTVTSLSAVDSTGFDYDQALNRPIINLLGDPFNPPVLTDMTDGLYKITGSYKIAASLPTIYATSSGHILLIETYENVKYIKRITAYRIYDYSIQTDGTVESTQVVTKDWIDEQGYATEEYLDTKLAALDAFTKEDAQKYIDETLESKIDGKLDEQINKVINERFTSASDEDINNLF